MLENLKLSRGYEGFLFLAESGVTLTDAVFKAGFGSYAQFYRIFTETYGKAPRAATGS